MKKAFEPVLSEKGEIKHIYDMRYDTTVDLTDASGKFGYFSYTLLSDDINSQEKPHFIPYNDHSAGYDYFDLQNNILTYNNTDKNVSAKIAFESDYIEFEYNYGGDALSEFGAYLPFNFMNRKNGEWEQQLLPSSPYNSTENNYHYCYFTRPDGNNLLLVCYNKVAGFKLDYSEYSCAHFYTGYRVLSNFDRAYGPSVFENNIKFRIYPVTTYDNALNIVADTLSLPVCTYATSWTNIGELKEINVIGQCDCIKIVSPSGTIDNYIQNDNKIRFIAHEYGDYTIIPFINEKQGIECRVFAFRSLKETFCNAVKSVRQYREEIIGKDKNGKELFVPAHIVYSSQHDFNLCEHCMWAWTALKYLKYNNDPIIKADVENFLSLLLTNEESLMIPHLTLVENKQGDNIPEYSTYKSNRIQEAFNGINILLEAYRLFNDRKYIEFAAKSAVAHMKNMHINGTIKCGNTDYSTVTAMIIPIVDCAFELEKSGDERAKFLKDSACYLADHVLDRGLDFPTETTITEETTPEIEEGSMSCSALTVLYVYFHISPQQRYVDYAKQVLQLHNAWRVFINFPQCFYSTLRWWETIWEGDNNGPAICCGHSWTIWRGEADYYYALITGDGKAYLRSLNAFMSNISKTQENGDMYAIYRLESIVAGGWSDSSDKISRRDAQGFPLKTDNTLSRYVFARADATIFKTVAVIGNEIFGANLRDDVLYPEWYTIENIFISDYIGVIMLRSDIKINVFTKSKYSYNEDSGIITLKIWE